MGDGTTTTRLSPVQIGTTTNWTTVSAGNFFTVAVRTDGTLWARGRNDHGQLGDGTNTHRHSPVQIGTATNWRSVSAGNFFTVTIRTDGTLWARGRNDHDQLGDGTTTTRLSFTSADRHYYKLDNCLCRKLLYSCCQDRRNIMGKGTE